MLRNLFRRSIPGCLRVFSGAGAVFGLLCLMASEPPAFAQGEPTPSSGNPQKPTRPVRQRCHRALCCPTRSGCRPR